MSAGPAEAGLCITGPEAARYFTARLGSPVVVRSLKQTFPGLSRETWLVDATVAGEPRGFVLRVDPPWGGGTPVSLRHEWEVYERLWRSPIPVAEPLWYEQGVEFAQGRAHMVRQLVAGSTTVPGLVDNSPSGADLRRRVVRAHVEKLAELHRLDWAGYGFDSFMAVPETPAEALRLEFDHWRRLWLDGRTEPYPMITEALFWLEEHIPRDTPFVSLVKGNNGVGEEIFQGGRIVAMSDWELASLGDGALDLGFSQGTLSLAGFGDAVRYYGECVGHEVSPQRLAFAMFWIMFKIIVCLNTCFLRGFIAGRDPRLASPAFGLLSVRQYERRLAASIGKDPVSALADLGIEGDRSTYAELGAR
jgi:aminoglycoside phosphotransferase (APT) family kinase protein